MVKNKVKFNIKNVHIAVRKEEIPGTVTYEKPFPVPGAVSISLEPQGELTPFYADGIVYYTASSNNGYEGDLEIAMTPDEYRQKVLGEVLDVAKVLFENANISPTQFALLFQIDGDQKSTRFCFYNCTSTRPTVESETVEETTEPGTETLTISAVPEASGIVRGKTTEETDAEVYNNWFNEVHVKQEAAV